ncbi:hypothetical protein KM043_004578 [Ampulex compressa]|nr:hypothetical protein KM043_004578 [Ampulex compressa]
MCKALLNRSILRRSVGIYRCWQYFKSALLSKCSEEGNGLLYQGQRYLKPSEITTGGLQSPTGFFTARV